MHQGTQRMILHNATMSSKMSRNTIMPIRHGWGCKDGMKGFHFEIVFTVVYCLCKFLEFFAASISFSAFLIMCGGQIVQMTSRKVELYCRFVGKWNEC